MAPPPMHAQLIDDRRVSMSNGHGARMLFVGFLTMLLLTAGGMVVTTHADDDEGTWALTADQAIVCIQTALSAQSGPASVKKIEAEDEDGQQLCEVKLVDETGNRHTVHVDVTTNRVVKIK
jgi:hypothetical protein